MFMSLKICCRFVKKLEFHEKIMLNNLCFYSVIYSMYCTVA